MGGSICKCDDKKGVDANEETVQGDEKVVHFRRRVSEGKLELTLEDVENRRGVAEPDLDKLRRDAAEREAAKSSSSKVGRVSVSNSGHEVIERSDAVDPPVSNVKRSKDRKGTGFVKKAALPVEDDDDEDEEEVEVEEQAEPKPYIAPAPKRQADPSASRVKNRKGTGFVKKGMLPVDDDEDGSE